MHVFAKILLKTLKLPRVPPWYGSSTVVVTQLLFKGEKVARRDSGKGCLSAMSEFEHGGFATVPDCQGRRSAEGAPGPGR